MAIVRTLAASSKSTNNSLSLYEKAVANTITKVLDQKALAQAAWDMRDITGQSTYDRTRAYLAAKAK